MQEIINIVSVKKKRKEELVKAGGIALLVT
jgi:hypothetical protein